MKLNQAGFTLIELVIVIIILAVVGGATTTYISTGVSLYSDISERDRGLNGSRFAMERLRRDILNALPNSLVVSNDSQCLTFTPIKASTVYGDDFPIAPLSGISASIATIDELYEYNYEDADKAVVYLLDADELGGTDFVQPISSIVQEVITFTDSATTFQLSSPSQRLYIINGTKSYYFDGVDELVLADDCDGNGSSSIMANNITGTFNISDATLQRNGLAKVTLNLNFDGQEVPIEQTLHINNVP